MESNVNRGRTEGNSGGQPDPFSQWERVHHEQHNPQSHLPHEPFESRPDSIRLSSEAPSISGPIPEPHRVGSSRNWDRSSEQQQHQHHHHDRFHRDWQQHRYGPPPHAPSIARTRTGGSDLQGNSDGPKPLRRELDSIHIFMIAISAVIGVGYYVKTGVILRVGGPGAVVYAYLFLGLLTLMITRNLVIMLRIWPVAGALIVFVEKFVDEEVGKSVAVLYWFTFSFAFAGLSAVIGDLADFLDVNTSGSVAVSVMALVVPIILNLMDIRIFRWIEVVFGAVKLILALCIIIIMNVMNPDVGGTSARLPSNQDNVSVAPRAVMFQNEENDFGGWFAAISASIFLASFSILGIEIVAATAQEASFEPLSVRKPAEEDGHVGTPTIGFGSRGRSITRVARHAHNHELTPIGSRLSDNISRGSGSWDDGEDTQTLNMARKDPFAYAMWVPIVATVVYVWGGWIVSQNIDWNDERLPTLEWAREPPNGTSSSVFVTSAAKSKFSHHLPTAMTSLLILHVVSTSSSVLYVASRTLFGFAYTISKRLQGKRRTWRYKVASKLATTNKFDVPYVAVLTSSWLFWFPFLKYASRHSFGSASDVITEMASVACILVWAFESLAAFRFYRCYKKHNEKTPSVRQDIKSVVKVDDNTWYFLHLAMAGLSGVLCLLIIFVGGSMILLLNLNPLQGVAAFSIILVFLVLTCSLKWDNGGMRELLSWGTNLDDGEKVKEIFEKLEDQKKHNLERQTRAPLSPWDLGGCIDSEWIREGIKGLL